MLLYRLVQKVALNVGQCFTDNSPQRPFEDFFIEMIATLAVVEPEFQPILNSMRSPSTVRWRSRFVMLMGKAAIWEVRGVPYLTSSGILRSHVA